MTPLAMHNQALEQMRRQTELLEQILSRLPEGTTPEAATPKRPEVHAGARPPATTTKGTR